MYGKKKEVYRITACISGVVQLDSVLFCVLGYFVQQYS